MGITTFPSLAALEQQAENVKEEISKRMQVILDSLSDLDPETDQTTYAFWNWAYTQIEFASHFAEKSEPITALILQLKEAQADMQQIWDAWHEAQEEDEE